MSCRFPYPSIASGSFRCHECVVTSTEEITSILIRTLAHCYANTNSLLITLHQWQFNLRCVFLTFNMLSVNSHCCCILVALLLHCCLIVVALLGYEPAGLTMHPPPKRSRVGSFFSHRCLVLPKFFSQRKVDFVGDKAQKTCFCVFLLKLVFHQFYFKWYTFKLYHSKGLIEEHICQCKIK